MRRCIPVLLIALAGCGEKPAPAAAPWPRLLTDDEIERYLRAESSLHLAGKSLDELRALCSIDQRELAYDLSPFGFTPQTFAAVAELVFFARHGATVFAELPREKTALARAVLRRLPPSALEAVRAELADEAAWEEPAAQEFATTVLANAQILAEYERRRASEQ